MEMVIFEIVSATKSICFLFSMSMFLVMSIMTCRKTLGGSPDSPKQPSKALCNSDATIKHSICIYSNDVTA